MSRILWLVLLLAPLPAGAGEILLAFVEHRDDRYRVEVDVRIDAPTAEVRRLVTDYEHLGELNPSITHTRVMAHPEPGEHRVRVEMLVCVTIFCRDLVQIQDVVVDRHGNIVANLEPEGSDFRYGVSRWQFWEEPRGTRMRYISEIEPDFWVPPLIGPWLIERALRRETLVTLENLERLAEADDTELR